jgi:drug/metabolite transporter (DMT)-like permease
LGSDQSHSGAIVLLCLGVGVFSIQDVVLKALSGGYPVHQAIVIRSVAALPFFVWLVRRAGGLGVRGAGMRRTLSARGLILMASYTCYYLALPAMPLASVVTLWFTGPLFLTALAPAIARERPSRAAWVAVAVGFTGVLVMVRPGGDLFGWVAALPVLAALMYAVAQLIARRVQHTASAPVMALYQNTAYLAGASVAALALRPLAEAATADPSLAFLLRAWALPNLRDLALLALCGPTAALGTTLLASAYRTSGSVVAPFEFTALVWATIWGAMFWGEVPGPVEIAGAAVIAASGAYAVSGLGARTRAAAELGDGLV